MFHADAFQEFRQAIALLRDGEPQPAMTYMRRAAEMDPLNAYYVSYLGVLVAQTEQRWTEAVDLCSRALKMERKHPQLYLNLAEVYLLAGRKQDAADTLSRGLMSAPSDYRLTIEYGKLVERRSPVISALPRQHILNRGLGRLRHRALQVMASL